VGLAEGEPSLQSTDANAALGAGLPALTVGLARVTGAHTLQEHADVGALPAGLDVLVGLVARRAGTTGGGTEPSPPSGAGGAAS
jgi:hypothetical protein